MDERARQMGPNKTLVLRASCTVDGNETHSEVEVDPTSRGAWVKIVSWASNALNSARDQIEGRPRPRTRSDEGEP